MTAMTQEEFDQRIHEIYGDLYDTSFDKYVDAYTPYKILCKKHGFFYRKPAYLIHQKQGCKACADEKALEKNRSYYSKKFTDKWGDSYSIVDWMDSKTNLDFIKVRCNTHNITYKVKRGTAILSDFAFCPKCRAIEEGKKFINKAVEIHGDKYSYDANDYVSSRDLMPIYCNKHKITFYQRPSAHLQGQGCPECGKEDAIVNSYIPMEDFLKRVHDKYNGKYDGCIISEYKGMHSKITVMCPTHNKTFTLIASNFLQGNECKLCSEEARVLKFRKEFMEKVVPKYPEFDFSEAVYMDNKTKVKVRCIKHNEYFYATPNRLKDSAKVCGCKVCQRLANNRWTIAALLKTPEACNDNYYFYTGKVSGLNTMKVGITANLNSRFDTYKRDLRNVDNTFNFSKVIEMTRLEATVLEVVLKKLFSRYATRHNIDFGGKHEVFTLPEHYINLVDDIMNGRFELEIKYLSSIVTHNNDKNLLNFVKLLERGNK